MRHVRLIICINCSSDLDWQWYEFLQESGKVNQVLSEPCGDHMRSVVFHLPVSPKDHVKMEMMYTYYTKREAIREFRAEMQQQKEGGK